jgi:hypothetical protein
VSTAAASTVYVLTVAVLRVLRCMGEHSGLLEAELAGIVLERWQAKSERCGSTLQIECVLRVI